MSRETSTLQLELEVCCDESAALEKLENTSDEKLEGLLLSELWCEPLVELSESDETLLCSEETLSDSGEKLLSTEEMPSESEEKLLSSEETLSSSDVKLLSSEEIPSESDEKLSSSEATLLQLN